MPQHYPAHPCLMQTNSDLHSVQLLLPLMPGHKVFWNLYSVSSALAAVLSADALVDDVRKLQLSQQHARTLAEKGAAPQDSGCSSACEDFDDEDRIRE